MNPGIVVDACVTFSELVPASHYFCSKFFFHAAGEVQGGAKEISPPEHASDKENVLTVVITRIVEDQIGEAKIVLPF